MTRPKPLEDPMAAQLAHCVMPGCSGHKLLDAQEVMIAEHQIGPLGVRAWVALGEMDKRHHPDPPIEGGRLVCVTCGTQWPCRDHMTLNKAFGRLLRDE